MNKEDLIVKVLNMLLDNKQVGNTWDSDSIHIWKYVLLRCRNAGVHFGKLEYANARDWLYRLSESRRIWYWKTKQWISLSELALYGLHPDSKVCDTIHLIEITEKEWAEIIPVKLVESFKNQKVYTPN